MKLIIVLAFFLGFVACIPDPQEIVIYPDGSGPAPMRKGDKKRVVKTI